MAQLKSPSQEFAEAFGGAVWEISIKNGPMVEASNAYERLRGGTSTAQRIAGQVGALDVVAALAAGAIMDRVRAGQAAPEALEAWALAGRDLGLRNPADRSQGACLLAALDDEIAKSGGAPDAAAALLAAAGHLGALERGGPARWSKADRERALDGLARSLPEFSSSMSNLATHRNGNEGSRRVLRRRAEALWAGEDWRAEAAKVHLFGWPQICGSLSERIENDSDFAMAVEELSAAMLGLREGSLGRRGAQSELAGMDHGAPEVARQLGGYGQWTRAADAMRAWRRDRPEEAKEWALQVEAKWLSRRRSWGRSSEALVKSRLALGGGAWTPAETDAALWILEDPRRAMGLDTGALLDDPMLKSCLDALGKESRSGNSWIAAKPSGEGLAGLRSALALAFEVSDLRDASGGRPPAKKAASRI